MGWGNPPPTPPVREGGLYGFAVAKVTKLPSRTGGAGGGFLGVRPLLGAIPGKMQRTSASTITMMPSVCTYRCFSCFVAISARKGTKKFLNTPIFFWKKLFYFTFLGRLMGFVWRLTLLEMAFSRYVILLPKKRSTTFENLALTFWKKALTFCKKSTSNFSLQNALCLCINYALSLGARLRVVFCIGHV